MMWMANRGITSAYYQDEIGAPSGSITLVSSLVPTDALLRLLIVFRDDAASDTADLRRLDSRAAAAATWQAPTYIINVAGCLAKQSSPSVIAAWCTSRHWRERLSNTSCRHGITPSTWVYRRLLPAAAAATGATTPAHHVRYDW